MLPAEEAELQRRSLHNLRLRLASLGIVSGVLVVIWALTGPELPWIVWPLLAIGLVAGLDAWRVVSVPPISETDVAGGPDREEALRALRRRRSLHHPVPTQS
jgi:2TM domain